MRAGHVARMEEGRSYFKILTGTPTGRPRRRGKDNIRMDLKEIGIEPAISGLLIRHADNSVNIVYSLELSPWLKYN